MCRRRSAAACLAFTILFATTPDGPAGAVPRRTAPPADEVARLAAVGRLWTAVRYAHPNLFLNDIDWDAALVKALPRIRAAADSNAYADAVAAMMDTLNDPASRIRHRPADPPAASTTADTEAPGAEPQPRIERRGDIVVLHMTDYQQLADYSRVMATLQQQVPILRDAGGVVVDLRQQVAGPGRFAVELFFRGAGPALTVTPVSPPAVRTVVHSGYVPQTGSSSGGYSSSLELSIPPVIQPAPGVRPKRVAFVVNGSSAIPGVALALQRGGDGLLVSEGPVDDTSIAPAITVDMGEGISATVRTGDVVHGGRPGVHADITIPAAPPRDATADPAMAAAMAFVSGGPRPDIAPPTTEAGATTPVWRADRAYADALYPSVEHRVLAVYRLWGIVDLFFPYKHLMSRDWDAALGEFIPRAIAARDALEYGQVIAEMATWLEDSHVGVDSPAMRRFYGEAVPPIALRYIEGVPVVTSLLDPAVTAKAGVEVGDVLVEVDGEPAGARAARLQKYLTVSNPWSARTKLARFIAAGADGSQTRLTLRGADGRLRDVVLPRKTSFMFARPPAGPEPSHRLIAPDIGYVDLMRLEVREVDPMVDSFLKTKAIIFDMRGYPRGVFMALAPRLNSRGAEYAATFLRPLVSAGITGAKLTFQQRIPPSTRPVYRGQVLMLIDERAVSQSEHTGLFLEQASGVRFVGSPTAGANGDVTRLVLPGGVTVGFTGHDVRHADGRQLQKVGLTSHVEITPTIAGIREGRDEVLERAIRLVREGM